MILILSSCWIKRPLSWCDNEFSWEMLHIYCLFVSSAAFEETLGCELLAAVWAQHLITLHAHSQQTLGGEGLATLPAQGLPRLPRALLSPPVLVRAQWPLQLLSEKTPAPQPWLRSRHRHSLLFCDLEAFVSQQVMTCRGWNVREL